MKEIQKLKQTINSLENRIIKNDETNDSLTLAIKLIMQDNTANVNEANQCTSNENPWKFINKKSPQSSNKVIWEAPEGKRTSNSSNQDQRSNNKFSVLKDLHNVNNGTNKETLVNQVTFNNNNHYSNSGDVHLTDNLNENTIRSESNPCVLPVLLLSPSHVCNLRNTKISEEKPASPTSRLTCGSSHSVIGNKMRKCEDHEIAEQSQYFDTK